MFSPSREMKRGVLRRVRREKEEDFPPRASLRDGKISVTREREREEEDKERERERVREEEETAEEEEE